MNRGKTIRWAAWLAGMLLLLALPAGAAEPSSLSGTILALDRAAGTITVGEIGAWHVKGGATEVTPRTIAVTPATEFKQVKRVAGPGPRGWAGDFAEVGLPAWEVKAGQFVTVQIQRDGEHLTAVKVQVTVTE